MTNANCVGECGSVGKIEERSLHCAARHAKLRRAGNYRATPVEMTGLVVLRRVGAEGDLFEWAEEEEPGSGAEDGHGSSEKEGVEK